MPLYDQDVCPYRPMMGSDLLFWILDVWTQSGAGRILLYIVGFSYDLI